MNIREIANKYELDQNKLASFVLNSDLHYKSTMFNGIEVMDDIDLVLKGYREYIAQKEAEQNAKRIAEEEELRKKTEEAARRMQVVAARNEAIRSTIITTTPVLTGYKIVKYCGIVSAESNIGTGFFSEISMAAADSWGSESGMFNSKLSKAKEDAENKLIIKAVDKGANAVIGVDFDILTLSNNAIVVSANGTAVKVEKDQ